MARTQYLSGKELDKLREALRHKFRRRNPQLKPIQATTYKEAYDDLRQDIIRLAPDAEQSVSLTRLRKLFYYTDPGACDAGQLENPSFGKDFLTTLDIYIADGPRGGQGFSIRRYGIYTVGLALPVLIGFVLWTTFFKPTPSEWSEQFDDLNFNRLKRNGWEILDYDSLFWRRQPRPGMLALYTLPGDYWIKPSEPRLIRNLLVHPLEGENMDISTRLVDFCPMQNHQQAGFILFDENKSRVQHIRVGYGFSGIFANEQNAEGANPKIGNCDVAILKVNETGQVFLHPFPVRPVVRSAQSAGMDTVYLHLSVRGDKCSVFYKSGFPWNQYYPIMSVDLDFRPAYLGLAAFQGWTKDDGTPKGADTIPAFFDWVEVRAMK